MKTLILAFIFVPFFSYAQFSIEELNTCCNGSAVDQFITLSNHGYSFDNELTTQLSPFKVYSNDDDFNFKLVGLSTESNMAIYSTADNVQGVKILKLLEAMRKNSHAKLLTENEAEKLFKNEKFKKEFPLGGNDVSNFALGNIFIYQAKEYIYVFSEGSTKGVASYTCMVIGTDFLN